jgi:hypothetical protein
MKIMVLGHKNHGKTTVANMLEYKFNFPFVDTTNYVINITRSFIYNNENPNVRDTKTVADFDHKLVTDKDSVRDLMKCALNEYTKDDPIRFIREQLTRSDVYAGCRSSIQYNAAKELIDLVLWVRDDRQEENDPTMDIQFDENEMILLNNSGTLLQLERNLKGVLHDLANTQIRTYDKTLRDSIISAMSSTQKSIVSLN